MVGLCLFLHALSALAPQFEMLPQIARYPFEIVSQRGVSHPFFLVLISALSISNDGMETMVYNRERKVCPMFFRPKFFVRRLRGMSVPKRLFFFFSGFGATHRIFWLDVRRDIRPKDLWADFSFLIHIHRHGLPLQFQNTAGPSFFVEIPCDFFIDLPELVLRDLGIGCTPRGSCDNTPSEKRS